MERDRQRSVVCSAKGQTYAGSRKETAGTAARAAEAGTGAGAGTRTKAQRAIQQPMIWAQSNTNERGRLTKTRTRNRSYPGSAAEAGSTPGCSAAASIDAQIL